MLTINEKKIGKPIFENSPVGDDNPIMTPKIAQDWATRYKKKLDLLYKYEYIDL